MQHAPIHPGPVPALPRPEGAAVWPQAAGWGEGARPWHVAVSPHDEQAWARFPLASDRDVAAAVARARADFEARWGDDADRAARLTILARLIDEVAARHEDLAQAISREIGAPIDFARARHVTAALDHLRATLDAARTAEDDTAPWDAPEHRVRHEPVGVAALITPWNWPLNQVALKVGAGLAAGVSMILKPSEYASASALIFAGCMARAGAGAGRFQLLLGDGAVGAALVAAPGVDLISFTGSTAVGRRIAQTAAAGFRRTSLELGGKSANILFADCDLDLALTQGLAHCFRNTGQSCNAASRMLVERPIYEAAQARAAEIARDYAVGAPDASGMHLGPLVNAAQFERVQAAIRTGLEEGARLIAGGPGRPDGIARGYYPRPTVFADVTPGMTLFHHEVFGPVLTMTAFDTEDEAIALANATDYGLAAYLQTADPARADRVARRLQAGMVQVNGSSRAPGAPFGGRRQSGWGREAGLWGIRAFQDIKSISGAARID
jgi:aldehyde dehydrogenase (NAD+)